MLLTTSVNVYQSIWIGLSAGRSCSYIGRVPNRCLRGSRVIMVPQASAVFLLTTSFQNHLMYCIVLGIRLCYRLVTFLHVNGKVMGKLICCYKL